MTQQKQKSTSSSPKTHGRSKKRLKKKPLVPLVDLPAKRFNTMIAAEDWIAYYNANTGSEKLTVEKLKTYLQLHNTIHPNARCASRTNDGILRVDKSKISQVMQTADSQRTTTNENRKHNISVGVRIRSLIQATRAEEEANYLNNALGTYENFLDHIANEVNKKIITNSSLRNSRNNYRLITREDVKGFGIKKETLMEINSESNNVQLQNKFFATPATLVEPNQEVAKLLPKPSIPVKNQSTSAAPAASGAAGAAAV